MSEEGEEHAKGSRPKSGNCFETIFRDIESPRRFKAAKELQRTLKSSENFGVEYFFEMKRHEV